MSPKHVSDFSGQCLRRPDPLGRRRVLHDGANTEYYKRAGVSFPGGLSLRLTLMSITWQRLRLHEGAWEGVGSLRHNIGVGTGKEHQSGSVMTNLQVRVGDLCQLEATGSS